MSCDKCTLDTVDYSLISVKSPRRFDSTNVCKISYDGGKLNLTLSKVKILLIKTPNPYEMYAQFKFEKKQLKLMRKFENQMVNVAVANAEEWFSHKITPALVEEYFISNLIYDEENGATFKTKLEDPCFELKDFKKTQQLDIVLRAKYLRFSKKSFVIGWSLEDVCVSHADYLFSSDESGNETDLEENSILENIGANGAEIVMGPDTEELADMIDELCVIATKQISDLETSLSKLKDGLESVQHNPSIKTVTELYEVIGEISV
jgi:hypothetical protein